MARDVELWEVLWWQPGFQKGGAVRLEALIGELKRRAAEPEPTFKRGSSDD